MYICNQCISIAEYIKNVDSQVIIHFPMKVCIKRSVTFLAMQNANEDGIEFKIKYNN